MKDENWAWRTAAEIISDWQEEGTGDMELLQKDVEDALMICQETVKSLSEIIHELNDMTAQLVKVGDDLINEVEAQMGE